MIGGFSFPAILNAQSAACFPPKTHASLFLSYESQTVALSFEAVDGFRPSRAFSYANVRMGVVLMVSANQIFRPTAPPIPTVTAAAASSESPRETDMGLRKDRSPGGCHRKQTHCTMSRDRQTHSMS